MNIFGVFWGLFQIFPDICNQNKFYNVLEYFARQFPDDFMFQLCKPTPLASSIFFKKI